MSIEQIIQANTAALLELTAAIQAGAPNTAGCAVAAKTTGKAAVKKEKTTAPPPDAVDPLVDALTYKDIQQPFLALVQSDRKAALALMAQYKVANLKELEGKPELFTEVLAAIHKASK